MDALSEPTAGQRAPSRYFFDAVVVQPTSLCNLDCAYCYLPHRHENRRMSREVARQIAWGLETMPRRSRPFTLVWHCGEPLASGLDHLEALFEPFSALKRDGRLQHALQTNATLIDRRWCDFFKAHSVIVGISLDGPATANIERVDWRGAASYDRVMRGVAALRREAIPFGVLAVVGEADLVQAQSLYRHFASLGCTQVGFNTEEPIATGPRRRLLDNIDAAGRFWRELASAFIAHPVLSIREFEMFCEYWDDSADGLHGCMRNRAPRARLYPTIGYDGKVTFLSPELLDRNAGAYGSFVVGNVLEEPLTQIAARAKSAPYVIDFVAGQDLCRARCEHFDICGGGFASKKFAEYGSTAGLDTPHCRMGRKRLLQELSEVMRTFPIGTLAASVLLPKTRDKVGAAVLEDA